MVIPFQLLPNNSIPFTSYVRAILRAMIHKSTLTNLYIEKQMSMSEIAEELNCSVHKVDYWMQKHKVESRSRSNASYIKHNADGDPFKVREVDTLYLAELNGVGVGLYWGEGTKANKNSVRLGNTDVHLINKFIEFLEKIYSVDKSKLRFSIQIFSDINIDEAEAYWQKELGVSSRQFTKTTVTKSGSIGTYRRKSKYGVLTVYFHNTKLRNILVDSIPSGGIKYMGNKPG